MKVKCSLLVILLGLMVALSQAQSLENSTWEVYIEYNIDDLGTDRVQFINLITGDVTLTDIDGENYTPLDNYLLYYDRINGMVMTARPDGTLTPHPFIQLGAARRVDWIVSSDQRLLAWTLTYDSDEGLTTVTSTATPAGTNQNLVLTDGPRNDDVRVLPVAFTVENSSLLMDSQPDGIGELAPYQQYANLFQLSLIDGTITPAQDAPTCFCAASLRAGELVRLAITSDFSGFDVSVYDLATQQSQLIPSIGLVNYTQGGNILISPDGANAVYALSQIEIEATEPTVRTVIMLVDLQTSTQRQLSDPLDTYLRPIRWTEDNTAVLFGMPDRNGTWKIDIVTGELVRVANATYIGILQN